MAYATMYELWRTTVGEAIFEVLLDLGHGEDFPLRTHPWFFGIRIPMTNKNADGLPSEEEEDRLNAVENRIREVAKSREGLYVGRRQGQGNRDLLFYFPKRPNGLDDRIRASMGTELLFISREDGAWKGYEALLPGPREWRRIEDSRIIATLLEKNSDPKAEHAVMHRVSTTIQKGAEALAELMKKLELSDVDIVGKKPDLIVVGVQKTALDADNILKVSFVLESKADKAKGKYLGWIAEPVGNGGGASSAVDDLDFDADDLDFELEEES
ncbi:MAG: DUF695 domain-containing protein [Deltaproteobacteria bacterium]|jgi:regulator of RNase E activity RraB|nr:DUF695 domain-containing protein [Deltaproteobacteria bacterium]